MSTRGFHIVEDDDVMHGYVVGTGARTCGKTIYRCVASWGDWTQTELGLAAGLDYAKAVVMRGEVVSP